MLKPVLAALLLAGIAAAAEGEDDADATELQELRARVEALERAALEKEVDAVLDEDVIGLGLTARQGDIVATLQIFGDVGFNYENPEAPQTAHASFFVGGVNAFFTAQVGEHFQVLSETVVKTGTTSLVVDQERLWGAWSFSDLFSLKLGLEHSPISRWNRIFHHGAWLEVAATRPFMARFESSGILLMHHAGLEAAGRMRTEFGRLEYILTLTNGRAAVANGTQKVSDANDAKAIDVGLSFAPMRVEGLQVGFVLHFDDIPPVPTVPARNGTIHEFVGSLYADYRGEVFELLAEYAHVSHDDVLTDSTFRHQTGYVQVAYRWKVDLLPYTRIDFKNMERGDPYYVGLNRDLDRWEYLLGIRKEITDNAALKVECGAGRGERRDAFGFVSKGTIVRFTVQLSWVF